MIINMIVPLIFILIIIIGLIKKVDILKEFIEGAKFGLETAFKILPILILILTATSIFRASGAMDLIIYFLSPIGNKLHIPTEVIPLWIIKPISGGGSIGVMTDIITQYGADSYIGRVAAVMATSTETTIYTIAIYSQGNKIKNLNLVLFASLAADTLAVVFAVIAVNLFY